MPHSASTGALQRLRLHRLLPPSGLERPEFAWPARIAFAAAVALLLAPAWPLAAFFAPAFVVGCRYHELSRFAAVRPSRWTFLLLALTVGGGTLWLVTRQASSHETPLLAAATLGAALAAAHLFAVQRRLAAAQTPTGLLLATDEDGPEWACGGLLAVLPVLFLLAFRECCAGRSSPLTLLWGAAALPLVALQLRRDARFPTLTIAWLAAGVALELGATCTAADDTFDDALAALAAVTVAAAALAGYLRLAPRVRATFGGAAAADDARAERPAGWRPVGAAQADPAERPLAAQR